MYIPKELKTRFKDLCERLEEILDMDEPDEEAIYEEICQVEEEFLPEVQDVIYENNDYNYNEELPAKLERELRSFEKLYKRALKLIKEIKREFDFYDPEAELERMFPNGTSDPDGDYGMFSEDSEDDW